jgi:hypothetical protein
MPRRCVIWCAARLDGGLVRLATAVQAEDKSAASAELDRTVRRVFIPADQHTRWELNDLARQTGKRSGIVCWHDRHDTMPVLVASTRELAAELVRSSVGGLIDAIRDYRLADRCGSRSGGPTRRLDGATRRRRGDPDRGN